MLRERERERERERDFQIDANDRCSEVLLGLSNSGLMTYKLNLTVSKPLNLSNADSQPERIETCGFIASSLSTFLWKLSIEPSQSLVYSVQRENVDRMEFGCN